MSLEEAHWRLSGYPALACGLKDRGVLGEGKPADVIVYDPDTVDALPQERLFDYPAGEMAAGPEGRRLRAHHRERRDHVHRRRVHERDTGASPAPRTD